MHASYRAVFGGEARWRLLRALFRQQDALHLRALAAAAEVDPAQAHRLLRQFVSVGLCERLEGTPHPGYRVSPLHPFHEALKELFAAEDAVPRPPADRPMKRFEDRSLALHSAAIERIQEDPKALSQARETLRRWVSRYAGRPPESLREWLRVLSLDVGQIRRVVLERSEYGDRLRKSSPLSTIVPKEERRRIYAAH